MPDENWRENLSDDLKGNESLATFDTIEALAKGFVETKALVGSGLRFPSEDASDDQNQEFLDRVLEKTPNLMMRPNFDDAEQSTEFFRTLGMPEKAGDYEIAVYEERKWDETREEQLRSLAHEARLTATQYKQLSEGMLKFDHEGMSTGEAKTMEEMSALKQKWGMTWEDRRGLANKVRTAFLDFIPEAQMDAKTIEALYAIGTQLGSEGTQLGDHRNDGGDNGKMTPSDALGQINDIMNNPEHAYWISGHPQNQEALDRMVELRKMADPTAGVTMPRAGFAAQ